MSIKLMQLAWDADLQSTEKIVLLSLSDQANDQGVAWPHIKSLARRCGCSKRTVFEALRDLESREYLRREIQPGIDTKVVLLPHLWERRKR